MQSFMATWENAHDEQYILFPQCSQMASAPDASVCFKGLTLSHVKMPSDTSAEDDFWKKILQKEKLLILSNFSFCNNDFNSI